MNDATTEVWLIDADRWAAELFAVEARLPRLSHDEESRAGARPDPLERRRRRAAIIACRLALERMFGPAQRGVSLPRNSLGRPYLPPTAGPGSFSYSHAGPYTLVGCTRLARIGVDIETPREIKMDPRRREIIIAAAAPLGSAPLPASHESRFLKAWTRLEALAKSDGRGIGHLLTLIGAVGGGPDRTQEASTLAHEVGVSVTPLDLGAGLYGAVALSQIKDGGGEFKLFTAPADIERLLAAS